MTSSCRGSSTDADALAACKGELAKKTEAEALKSELGSKKHLKTSLTCYSNAGCHSSTNCAQEHKMQHKGVQDREQLRAVVVAAQDAWMKLELH